MNRRKFLGNLVKGAAVAVAAPLAVNELLKEKPWGEIAHNYTAYNSELGCPAEIGWVETSQGNMWYLKSEAEVRTRFEEQLEFQCMTSYNRGGSEFYKIDWDLLK